MFVTTLRAFGPGKNALWPVLCVCTYLTVHTPLRDGITAEERRDQAISGALGPVARGCSRVCGAARRFKKVGESRHGPARSPLAHSMRCKRFASVSGAHRASSKVAINGIKNHIYSTEGPHNKQHAKIPETSTTTLPMPIDATRPEQWIPKSPPLFSTNVPRELEPTMQGRSRSL